MPFRQGNKTSTFDTLHTMGPKTVRKVTYTWHRKWSACGFIQHQ